MTVIVWATTKEEKIMKEAVFVRTTIEEEAVMAVVVWATTKEETRTKEAVVVQTTTIQETRT